MVRDGLAEIDFFSNQYICSSMRNFVIRFFICVIRWNWALFSCMQAQIWLNPFYPLTSCHYFALKMLVKKLIFNKTVQAFTKHKRENEIPFFCVNKQFPQTTIPSPTSSVVFGDAENEILLGFLGSAFSL